MYRTVCFTQQAVPDSIQRRNGRIENSSITISGGKQSLIEASSPVATLNCLQNANLIDFSRLQLVIVCSAGGGRRCSRYLPCGRMDPHLPGTVTCSCCASPVAWRSLSVEDGRRFHCVQRPQRSLARLQRAGSAAQRPLQHQCSAPLRAARAVIGPCPSVLRGACGYSLGLVCQIAQGTDLSGHLELSPLATFSPPYHRLPAISTFINQRSLSVLCRTVLRRKHPHLSFCSDSHRLRPRACSHPTSIVNTAPSRHHGFPA